MPSFSVLAGSEGFSFCGDRKKIVARSRVAEPKTRLQTPSWSLNCEPPPPWSGTVERSVMKRIGLSSLALAGSLLVAVSGNAQYADAVVSYTPGAVGNPNFTNATAALGEPSRVNPFGESTDPFNPPYGTNQIVSLGAGGSLTLRLSTPIANDPSHPFGVDFILFGNSGFIITNGDFSGGGITDGTLFGNNPSAGGTRVSLTNADFAGLDLNGIRSKYNGSAGGSPYDLNDAMDGSGVHVDLADALYVRIDVLQGGSEIDALSVVPEPSTWVLAALGAGAWWLRRRRG